MSDAADHPAEAAYFGRGFLPLKRGSDGRLGVTVSGQGGGDNTVVNITVNQSGGEDQNSNGTNPDAKALASRIKSVVVQVIADEKRPGGLLYH
jgi:phage-related minor tail protein